VSSGMGWLGISFFGCLTMSLSVISTSVPPEGDITTAALAGADYSTPGLTGVRPLG